MASVRELENLIEQRAQRAGHALIAEILDNGYSPSEMIEQILSTPIDTPTRDVGAPLHTFLATYRALLAALTPVGCPLEVVERAAASGLRAAARL